MPIILLALGLPHLVQAQTEDTALPVLTGVSVSPQQVDLSQSGQTVQVTRSATDDVSGVAYGGASCTGYSSGLVFTSPSGNQSVKIHNCSFSLSSGTALDGEFTASANFPQFAESGVWQMTSMILEDQAGNWSTLTSSQMASLGISASVEVISVGDITPPVLTGVAVSPQQVNTSQSSQVVLVTRSVSDDVSGVAYGGTACTNFVSGLVFTSPSGGQTVKISNCNFAISSGSKLGGDFSANVIFPQYAEQGFWQLTSTLLEDQAGNTSNLGAGVLAALGISASVEVVSLGDTAPPVLSDVSVAPQLIDTSESAQTVQVTRAVSDDVSGVAFGGKPCTNFVSSLVFTSPSGGQSVKVNNCSFALTAGSEFSGEFAATAHFPQYSESGVWPLTSIILEDQAGNTSTLHAGELTALGIETYVEVAFDNYDIDFNSSGFIGTWSIIDNGDNSTVFSGSGDQSINLVPGFYSIDIGQNLDWIEVELDGNVVSGNPEAYTGGQGQVTFNPVSILIDPTLYQGLWGILNVAGYNTATEPGPQVLELVRNLNYSVRIAGSSTSQFDISVDDFGMISSQNTVAASASGSTLTFNTADMYIDPGLYPGDYAVWGVVGFDATAQPGIHAIKLLPALNYNVRITGEKQAQFTIGFSASGQVTSFNLDAATGMADVLLLNTTLITVDPGTYAGLWQVRGAFGSNGIDSVELPPGLGYKFFLSSQDTQIFAVSEPCAVDPNQFNLAGESFTLSCGTPDADNDGVPDDTDNCPLEPNPDQVDQDLDGIGNLCDDDLDGDNVDNPFDNCPDLENAGQEDQDGDGIGDACDDDADGDSVNNAFDNCPDVVNTDQSDNDLDQFGDVCDADDDNDFVLDDLDNCPLDHNPGQEDYDMNGQGDICDGDVDGDGVLNEQDLCELSPQSLPTNMEGCTGAQFIVLQCQAANYVQHGQYVSCVAHAANESVLQGLILPNEKARFVREAARSK